MGKTIVIKLGGSLLSDSEKVPFDFVYLKKFAGIIRKYVKKDYKFAIVTGGGYMMRRLRDEAKEAGISEEKQLHWIGTTYNNVNAEITRAYMHDICNERIVAYDDYYSDDPLEFEKSVILGGGGRPGHSGDMDAFLLAQKLGSQEILTLKNVDGVYTDDPKKDPNATRLDKLTWDEYFKIIGYKNEHDPGGNYPIDPVTSKKAKEQGTVFFVILGEDLDNFEVALEGREFVGTTVGPT